MQEVLGQEEIERLFRQIEGAGENEIGKIISNELLNNKSKDNQYDCIRDIEYLDLNTEYSDLNTEKKENKILANDILNDIITVESNQSLNDIITIESSQSLLCNEGEGEDEKKKDELFHSCKCEIRKKSEEIRKILKDNTKTTNYILEIVQLIAPAVAQMYLGMSGLAIVGAITILCKQGIQQMIE